MQLKKVDIRLSCFVLAMLLVAVGCKKKVVEIYPVLQVTDKSIPDTAAVLSISFINDQVGLAGTATGIWTTSNGGDTWVNSTVPNGKQFSYVELYDADHGVARGRDNNDRRTVFVTTDGGQTWTSKGQYDLIGFMEDGTVIRISYAHIDCDIDASTNFGTSWSYKATTPIIGLSGFMDAKIVDDQLFLFSDEDVFERYMIAFDLNTETAYYFYLPDFGPIYPLTDICKGSDGYYLSGQTGVNISARGSNGLMEHARNAYDYYGVDAFGGLVVYVGENTIATNMDIGDEEDYLHEMYLEDLNGFDATFYDVEFLNDTTVLLSGNNGLFWRANL